MIIIDWVPPWMKARLAKLDRLREELESAGEATYCDAQRPGRCRSCEQAIHQGDRIVSIAGFGAMHRHCWERHCNG